MIHTIVPGLKIESLTEEETRALIRQEFRATVREHVRAEGVAKMDATGSGLVEIYTCPIGFEFEVRRILIASDVGYFWVRNVPGGGAGAPSAIIPLEYLRSGESIGRVTQDYVIRTAVPQDEVWYLFPHLETWGDQQGPYIRNGETLELAVRNCVNFASVNVQVTVEGLQGRPPPRRG